MLRLAIPLREPFVTSQGVLAERELVVIRLEDDDGTIGGCVMRGGSQRVPVPVGPRPKRPPTAPRPPTRPTRSL